MVFAWSVLAPCSACTGGITEKSLNLGECVISVVASGIDDDSLAPVSSNVCLGHLCAAASRGSAYQCNGCLRDCWVIMGVRRTLS